MQVSLRQNTFKIQHQKTCMVFLPGLKQERDPCVEVVSKRFVKGEVTMGTGNST